MSNCKLKEISHVNNWSCTLFPPPRDSKRCRIIPRFLSLLPEFFSIILLHLEYPNTSHAPRHHIPGPKRNAPHSRILTTISLCCMVGWPIPWQWKSHGSIVFWSIGFAFPSRRIKNLSEIFSNLGGNRARHMRTPSVGGSFCCLRYITCTKLSKNFCIGEESQVLVKTSSSVLGEGWDQETPSFERFTHLVMIRS